MLKFFNNNSSSYKVILSQNSKEIFSYVAFFETLLYIHCMPTYSIFIMETFFPATDIQALKYLLFWNEHLIQ